ncbi:MAG: hypothetical protein AAFP17_00605 [Pseudomonadota bacterium]
MTEIAYIAMVAFPFMSMLVFLRFGVQHGIAWTVIIGFLFLPLSPTLNLPLLPTVNRTSVPVVCALLFATLMMRGRAWKASTSEQFLPGWLPTNKILSVFAVVAVTSSTLTILTNRDSGSTPFGFLQATELTDIGAMTYELLFPVLLLLLGRRFLSDENGALIFLKVVGLMGVAYGALIVLEWRLSPMLKFWVYGIWDINWVLATRSSGFRPVVFMQSGLQASIFQAMASIAAIAVFRASNGGDRTLWRFIALFCLACLPFTQSMAAIILGFGFSLVAFFGSKRQILIIVALIAGFVFTYPVLRMAEVVPTTQMVSAARVVSDTRAGSLAFRFQSEDRYIDRALIRPFFGWGQRERDMPRTADGERAAIPDSNWSIITTQRGFVAFVAIYGLFTLPTIVLWRKRRVAPINHVVLGLSLIVCVALLDKLLNSFFTPILWIGSGALIGVAERVVLKESTEAAAERRAALEIERSRRRGKVVIGPSAPKLQGDVRVKHSLAHKRR